MKGKNLTKLIGGLGVVCVLIFGIYLAMNLKSDDSVFEKDSQKNTEAQNILAKDVERNYPATVREVVRLYSRISKCYYNEAISEEEFTQLAQLQRNLFDEEFLEHNPWDTFIESLANEVIAAKTNKETMMHYVVQKQSSVKEWDADEMHYAKIIACYTMKGEDYTKTYEEFLLREDASGRWKIVGWRLTDAVEISD